ncbi:MAG: DNA repair protein RecO [bacterium]
MLAKTEAIVLKSSKFRDTSKLVYFYSRNYGKLKGIAKGARTLKSKFGASLEPITKVSVVLYKKEQRDLHLISQCDTLKVYKQIHSDFEKIQVALAILDLTHQLSHEEEENSRFFLLLSETLDELNSAEKQYLNFFYAFVLRLGAILGFSAQFDRCPICHEAVAMHDERREFIFRADKGAVMCQACSYAHHRSPMGDKLGIAGILHQPPSQPISFQTVRILQRLNASKLSGVAALHLDGRHGNEMNMVVRSYIHYHFEGLKPLKALEMVGVHW